MSTLTVTVDLNDREDIIKTAGMLESLALYGTTATAAAPVKVDENLDNSDAHGDNASGEDLDKSSNVVNINENLDDVHNMSKANDGAEIPAVELAQATTIDVKIPWDVRIHSGSKTKLAKAPNGWTLKRNVEKNSPGLVAQVEKELAAVMSASPEKPIETAAATTTTDGPKAPSKGPAAPKPAVKPSAPVAPTKYLIEGVAYTADELKGFDSGWTDENIAELEIAEPEIATAETETTTTTATDALTWPALLAKITTAKAAGDIDDAAVTAACNAQGLESIQLVGARPDLWPAIDEALFA